MRVERTAKLSIGVARQRVRQVDRNSVVVGGHLLGRDETGEGVCQEERLQQRRPENSCENILRRTAMCEVLLHYVAFQQHTSSLDL